MSRQSIPLNKTGAAAAGATAIDMLEGTEDFSPSSSGDETAIAELRAEYAREGGPVGSMPPPLGADDVGDTVTMLLADKLGERLAFERSGVRLYQALLSKFDAYGSFAGGPERSNVEHILHDELSHFRMLTEAIRETAGDPTAVTPSADVQATISRGILDILLDSRTNLIQSLEAILVAELADNDCWRALSELADSAGEEELAEDFREALANEQDHLEMIRGWLAVAQGRKHPRPLH